MDFRVCSLFSGSSGNSTYIGAGDTHILIDAGQPGKDIIGALSSIGVDGSELKGILVTHEHSDHIKSVGVLSRKFDIPIYANEKTWEAMDEKIGKTTPYNRIIFNNDMDFYIGNVNIEPYSVSHDAADPVGFCIYHGNKKISIATDLGYTNSNIIKTVMDSDLVILEANHDVDMLKAGKYPVSLKRRILGRKGHLSNFDAASALLEMVKGKVTHVLLAHLSKENNYPQLAYQTVAEVLEENGVIVGRDIRVDMTYRDRTSNLYRIG